MFKTTLTKDAFMSNCTACGGNWTAMLMSGIKHTMPELYDAMPNVKYDFATICQLVNLICTDNEADADSLMDAFHKMLDGRHYRYWAECLLKANNIVVDLREASFLAFLWMFKYLANEADYACDIDYYNQMRATCEYLAKYEAYLETSNRYDACVGTGYEDDENAEQGHAPENDIDRPMKLAKDYVHKQVADTYTSEIDADSIWDAMLEEDDFVNQVNRCTTEDAIEIACDEFMEYVIEENGISVFSNRDPYFFEH